MKTQLTEWPNLRIELLQIESLDDKEKLKLLKYSYIRKKSSLLVKIILCMDYDKNKLKALKNEDIIFCIRSNQIKRIIKKMKTKCKNKALKDKWIQKELSSNQIKEIENTL